MREARVKKIKLHREDLETGEKLWEVYYDQYDSDIHPACPMVWRAHAQDELDIWVQFNEWFKSDTRYNEGNQGEPNNVIWL